MASFVSHKYKLIFCHIPRTGGTSFFEAIKPHLGEKDELDTLWKHEPLKRVKLGRLSAVFDNYLKLAIIRDEQDRVKSLRLNNPKGTGDYMWSTWDWICDDEGYVLLDQIIRFEGLPNSACGFLRNLGIQIEDEQYPHLNKHEPE